MTIPKKKKEMINVASMLLCCYLWAYWLGLKWFVPECYGAHASHNATTYSKFVDYNFFN